MKKDSFKVFSLSFAIFILFLPLTARQKDAKKSLEGFPSYVERVMKEFKVPGSAISIVKEGKVIFAQGFGFRDVKKRLKVSPHTLFAIGSSTKAFTATALGILVDEGKLDWDKPLREYLPDFRLKDPFASERITPRDLVIHDCGLPRHDSIWYGSSETREEIYRRLQYLEPSKDFRSTFQYNNLMFMTAGYLLGKIAQKSWEEFVRERIFNPLGMKESNFSVEDSKKAEDFALPYLERENEVIEIPFRNLDAIGPAGSINSNVLDMAQWVLLNLNKGKFEDKQIISEASLKKIHSPQMVMEEMFPGFEKYHEISYEVYGMGWMLSTYRGHLMLHHAGGIDGFTALVSFMPWDDVGIVALSNLNENPLPFIVTYNAYERLLGLDQTPWDKRFKKVFAKIKEETEKAKKEGEKDRVKDTTPSHALEDYEGEYENPGYGIIKVEKKGESLSISYNYLKASISHFHYDIFEVYDEIYERRLKVSFFIDFKGNIEKLSIPLEQAVEPIVFRRMPEKKMMERGFLEKLVGEYELQGLTLIVSIKGEKTLVASVPGQGEVELLPYRGTEFNLKNMTGYSIEFLFNEEGVVREAKVKQPGGVFTARRK